MSHHLQPTTTITNESNNDESNARGAKLPADLDQPKLPQNPLRPRPLPTSRRTTPNGHRPQSTHPHGSDRAHHLDPDSQQAQTTPDPRHPSRPRLPHRLRSHHRCQPRAHRAHLPPALHAPSQWSLHLHRTPHNGHQRTQRSQTHGPNQIQMAFLPLQPTSASQLLPTWNHPMPSGSASRNPATISSHSLSRGPTSETSPTTCPQAVNNSPHSPIGRSLPDFWVTPMPCSVRTTTTKDLPTQWRGGDFYPDNPHSTQTNGSTPNRRSRSHSPPTPPTQRLPFWPASFTPRWTRNELWLSRPTPTIPLRPLRPSWKNGWVSQETNTGGLTFHVPTDRISCQVGCAVGKRYILAIPLRCLKFQCLHSNLQNARAQLYFKFTILHLHSLLYST